MQLLLVGSSLAGRESEGCWILFVSCASPLSLVCRRLLMDVVDPTWIGGTHIFVFVFVLVSFITAIDSRSHGC